MRESIKLLFVVMVCLLLVTACVPVIEEVAPAEEVPIQVDETQLEETPIPTDATQLEKAPIATDETQLEEVLIQTEETQLEEASIQADESQLEALALRLVSVYGPNGETDRSNARLLPGELPAGLEIPLLPKTAVIGSFLDGYGSTQIVLDVEEPVEKILAFYEEAFSNGEWQKAPEPPTSDGFTPSEMGQTYCQPTSKETLWLMVTETKNSPTEVRLSIRPEEAYSACDPNAYNPNPQGPYSMIPALRDPNGSQQTSGGSGSSDNEANAYVYLIGELNLQEAIDHYAAQLEKLGWMLTSETETDLLIMTSWTFQDEGGQDWVGILSAYQWPEAKDRLSVHLQILQMPD